MSKYTGFRAHIEAGRGLTHILTPDGGAIPLEKIMDALAFKAEIRGIVARYEGYPVIQRTAEPDCNLEAAATAEPPMAASFGPQLEAYTVTWIVDYIRRAMNDHETLAAQGIPQGLTMLVQDIANMAHRERLGEFGHHPEPEQDWLIEVEALDGEFLNMRMEFSNGTPNMFDLRARIWKALHCGYAIKCGNELRRAGFPNAPHTIEVAEQLDRFQTHSRLLGERHVALTQLMHELGEMQFSSMREDAEKLDTIVGNAQSILYSQRSLLSRVADRLRRIYEAS